jgi:hypothetical protein
MAADVMFTVKKAMDEQTLIPATVNEELETRFVKKAKSSSIKLIPISFIVAAIILAIIFVVVYFFNRLIISALALFCIFFPIYSIYDAIATSKALKNHDYEFFYGEVIGKTDSGSYVIKGLEECKISVLFGKNEYNAGDRAIVARVKDDLNIISEE